MRACLDSVSPDKANCGSCQKLLVTDTTALYQRGAYQGLPISFGLRVRQAKCNWDFCRGIGLRVIRTVMHGCCFFPKVNAYI